MTGQKALRLEAFCREHGHAFLRFDYTGHGASSARFEDGTIGRWTDDAVFALDHLTEGPQVLVGSSLGGWISTLVALKRPHRVAALLGIAAAPDFTEDLIPKELTAANRDALARDGIAYLESPYDPEPTPITQALLDEGRTHLVLRAPIPLTCPVRLIHGMKDADVPWETSLRLMEQLSATDAELQLVKNGDHRLSEEADLTRLTTTLDNLLSSLRANDASSAPIS
jgi:pimeloyl-ACP methyl ester carboxylesterase